MGPVFALVYVQAFDAQMHTDALIAATATAESASSDVDSDASESSELDENEES